MHRFDPEFADAFYTLTWQGEFHQSDTLARITQPATVVHANWRVTDKGILEGAMTDQDAVRARGLLADGTLERVKSGHGFHFEKPRAFVSLIKRLAARVATP